MPKTHNATGRNTQPSKAQRQQALANPRTQPTLPSRAPQTTVETTQTTATTEQPTPPATSVVPFTGKGAAMKTRWMACLRARPGQKGFMPSDIKVLSRDSMITSVVPGNPKKQRAAKRYELYGFNMVQGATTTIQKYVDAVSKLGKDRAASWATEGVALADIAWDLNHNFIKIDVPVAAPVNETHTEEVVASAAEEAKIEGTTTVPEGQPVEIPAPESIPAIEGEPEEITATAEETLAEQEQEAEDRTEAA